MRFPLSGRRPRRQRRPLREQRSAHRYPAVEGQARFGWWDEETFHDRDALILDISLTGVLLLTDQVPPSGLGVWLRVNRVQDSGWIAAKVVGAETLAPCSHMVRLALPEPCPYPIFRLVVYGTESCQGKVSAPTTEGPEGHKWW